MADEMEYELNDLCRILSDSVFKRENFDDVETELTYNRVSCRLLSFSSRDHLHRSASHDHDMLHDSALRVMYINIISYIINSLWN